jgi:hypothetical protein
MPRTAFGPALSTLLAHIWIGAFAGAAVAQTESPAMAAAVSQDPRAIFGLLVGGKLPNTFPCRDSQVPRGQPYCYDRADISFNTGVVSAGGGALGPAHSLPSRVAAYRKAGANPLTLRVNAEMFDTSLVHNVLGMPMAMDLWVSPDRTIQMLMVKTRLGAFEATSGLLERKFGKPTHRDVSEWNNARSGQPMSKTPNLRWYLPDVAVDYESQTTSILGMQTSMGAITIHAGDFARRVIAIERESAPPPKKGM